MGRTLNGEPKSWVDEIVEKSDIKEVVLVKKNGEKYTMTAREFVHDMKNILMSGQMICDHVEFIAHWMGVNPKEIADR